MGRRSKADLYDVVDRILELYTKDKLTIKEIADQLKRDGIDMSREAVRRSIKNTREAASELKKSIEEARVMMDAARDNPNTDLPELITTKLGCLLWREAQEIDAIEFDDPAALVAAAGRLADSQVKIGRLKMQYQSGFEAAKKTVLSRLKEELKSAPDIVERIAAIVNGIEPEVK